MIGQNATFVFKQHLKRSAPEADRYGNFWECREPVRRVAYVVIRGYKIRLHWRLAKMWCDAIGRSLTKK